VNNSIKITQIIHPKRQWELTHYTNAAFATEVSNCITMAFLCAFEDSLHS